MAEYKEHKVEGQINLGWNLSFAPSAAVPMIAKRLWDTLEQATLYAKEDPTAIVGLILTVSKDTEENNGVYYVKATGENAVLQKVGSDFNLSEHVDDVTIKVNEDGKLYAIAEEVTPYITSVGENLNVTDGVLTVTIPEAPIKGITVDGNDVTITEGVAEISLADSYVSKEGYNEFTSDEKDKLANLPEITGIGDNLSLVDGTLSAVVPEVTIPVTDVTVDGTSVIDGGVAKIDLSSYAKTTDVDSKIVTALTSVYKYKGSVATYEDLPSTETVGDVYNVESTGDNYAWDGTTWDKLGATVDLSGYALKTDLKDWVETTTFISHVNNEGTALHVTAEEKETWSGKQDAITETNKIPATLVDGLTAIATTGSYNDLSDKPAIPTTVAELTDASDYAKTTDIPTNVENLAGIENYAKTETVYSKEEADSTFVKVGEAETNVIEVINIKTDKDTDATPVEVVEKAVTIDLSGIDERLDVLEAVINPGGSDTNITDLIAGKQDKLANGSAEQPHLIWDSTNTKWTPGKIDALPSTDSVESPAILAWDGENVIWSSSELQKELPTATTEDAGKVLTVAENGTDVIWSTPLVTTVTASDEKVSEAENAMPIKYIINDGTTSSEVYSAEAVDSMLTWQKV